MTSGHNSKRNLGDIVAGEIVAIHGFLGLARDWSSFGFTSVDLWSGVRALAQAETGNAFEDWAKRFNDRFMAGRSEARQKPWLVGYSLGGRLAMHAVLKRPELYSGAVFVSANPGLTAADERTQRRHDDFQWAGRFRTENWTTLIADWNAQPVLKTVTGAPERLDRQNTDFDRAALAAALEIWSLGKQRDLRAELVRLSLPVLYLTGEEDSKFSRIIADLELLPTHQHKIISGAGHRVPWDRPREFIEALRGFMAAHS